MDTRNTAGAPGALDSPGSPDSPDTGESPDLPRTTVSRAAMAALLVPTCLGLLGFFAVAAAVSSTEASVRVTLPGLLIVLTGLALAACAPLLMSLIVRGPVRRPLLGFAAVLAVQALIAVPARDTVLFTLPAVPTALIGGLVLLSTSLLGQFRKGPVPDPILDPVTGPPQRSFGFTLLVALSSWMLFMAAAAMAAWLLLRS